MTEDELQKIPGYNIIQERQYHTMDDFENCYNVLQNKHSLGRREYLVEKFCLCLDNSLREWGRPYDLYIGLLKLRRKLLNSYDHPFAERTKEIMKIIRSMIDFIKEYNMMIRIYRRNTGSQFLSLFYYFSPQVAFHDYERYLGINYNKPWIDLVRNGPDILNEEDFKQYPVS